MARIRTLKPEFPQSESIGKLSRDARLLFIQLWTVVDDSGKARASSRLLASLLYPYDDDARSLMDGWVSELEDSGMVRRYSHEGTDYLDIPKWLKHQKIDRPSKSRLPVFDESSRILASPREPSTTDLGPRTVDLGPRTMDRKPLAPRRNAAKPVEVVDPGVLDFPTVGNGAHVWPLTQAHIDEWSSLFPNLDVIAECRKALAWVQSDETRRKTARGMKRFIVGWLTRATDLGSRPAGPNPHSKTASNKANLERWLDGRPRMTEPDRPQFAKAINVLGETFGVEITPLKAEVYFDAAP